MKTKTFIITGATSGIGKALIKTIAKDHIVFAGYRNESNLGDLTSISENIYPFYIDYEKPETIKSAVDFLHTKLTKVDTLVNIAGCVVAGPIEKIDINELKRQFDVNVFGHLDFTRNLLDLLDGGKVINISSMASYGFFPFISPYCASKRAMDIFFNAFLIESKKNIKIVSIKPGVIATPLWGKSIKENLKYMNNCTGYEREMKFLIDNAQKNEIKGLSVDKVVKTILEADKAKNPKLTYTVGKDALGARFLAKIPQEIVNKIIKLGLKLRVK